MRQGASYRDDIDGLRAVAIALVLFYHLQVKLFAGGYVGVDVFFVISGFLITGNIRRDIATSSFSFREFYLRRIRRLAPALLVTIAVSFIVAGFLFSAPHLQRFGGEVATSLLWTSNIYFHLESGYFDASSAVKPLLHTWSLSVEEQFYLIWPLLLFAALPRLGGWRTPALIAGLSLVSLLSAEVLLGQGWNLFFLTPFRLFEFGIGALLTWVVHRRPKAVWIEESINIAGLGMILLSALIFDESVPFPSTAALLPCLGAAMVLYAGTARYSGALLRNPLSRHTGKISYSLYLVHWPIIVFYAYATENSHLTFGRREMVTLLILTVILAEVLHRFVETPYRNSSVNWPMAGKRVFLPALTALTLVFSVAGAHAFATQGWLWRLSADDIALARAIQEKPAERGDCQYYGWGRVTPDFEADLDRCYSLYGPAVIVIGDSHGIDLFNALAKTSSRHHLPGIARGGCRVPEPAAHCDFPGIAEFILANSDKFKGLIYTQSAWNFADRSKTDEQAVQSVLDYLKQFQIAGIEVVWVGPQREPRIDLAKVSAADLREIDLQETEARVVYRVDAAIAEVAREQGVTYVSKVEATKPYAPDYLTIDGQITYRDPDHWSEYGRTVFGKALLSYSPELTRLLNDGEEKIRADAGTLRTSLDPTP